MITAIIAKPGAGKSSLMVTLIQKACLERGEEMLANSRQRIEKFNETRLYPLTVPDRVPIYADFEVTVPVGYKKTFKPYWIQGYYFGLPNEDLQVEFIPPGSMICLDEAARYYNSRKSATMPDWVSRAYDMQRHFGLNIILSFTRDMMADATIREIFHKIIFIEKLEHEKNGDYIRKSTWHCKEFNGYDEYEAFRRGECEGVNTTYTYKGNVFDCYDSFTFGEIFLPPDGKDFDYLEPLSPGELTELKRSRPELAPFYERREPDGYRKKKKPETVTKSKKEDKT